MFNKAINITGVQACEIEKDNTSGESCHTIGVAIILCKFETNGNTSIVCFTLSFELTVLYCICTDWLERNERFRMLDVMVDNSDDQLV